MLEFKSITIEDKTKFDKILKTKKYMACEYIFTNFFIWKDAISTEYCLTENTLYVRGKIRGETFYFMPVTIEDTLDNAMMRLIEAEGDKLNIKCANDMNIAEMSSGMLNKFRKTDDSNLNDYVYNSIDLVELKGKQYHQKRNHINKFRSLYDFEFQPLTEADVQECLTLNEVWKNTKEEETIEMKIESRAIKNALTNFSRLNLTGGVIRIDGEIKGFTIGEIIHEDLGVVHFEKCDVAYNGIFPAINQLFAEYAFKDVKYINRQDDMGLPGLRKSKCSYHPAFMVQKYILKYEG